MDNGESAYRRFLDGDEAAFSLVMEIYKNNLIFFINRYVRNFAIAEEISEDVFVELLIHKALEVLDRDGRNIGAEADDDLAVILHGELDVIGLLVGFLKVVGLHGVDGGLNGGHIHLAVSTCRRGIVKGVLFVAGDEAHGEHQHGEDEARRLKKAVFHVG